MNIYNIIKRPLVTEKSVNAGTSRATFEVNMGANKHQVREAVEKLFGVHVNDVNTMIVASKPKRFGRNIGRRAKWKKAIVTLQDGETIKFLPDDEEIVEGGEE